MDGDGDGEGDPRHKVKVVHVQVKMLKVKYKVRGGLSGWLDVYGKWGFIRCVQPDSKETVTLFQFICFCSWFYFFYYYYFYYLQDFGFVCLIWFL